MCAHVLMRMRAQDAHACLFVLRSEIDIECLLQSLPMLFLSKVNSERINSSRPMASGLQGSPPTRAGVIGMCPCTWLLHGCWEYGLRPSSCLNSSHFTNAAFLLSMLDCLRNSGILYNASLRHRRGVRHGLDL